MTERRFFRTGSRPPSVLDDAERDLRHALVMAHAVLQVLEAAIMVGRPVDLKLVRSARKSLSNTLHATERLPDLDEGLSTLAKRLASEIQSEVNAAARKVAAGEREGEADEDDRNHPGRRR